jgi:hypothetical protein
MEENGPTFMVVLHWKERGKFMFWGFKGVENEPN